MRWVKRCADLIRLNVNNVAVSRLKFLFFIPQVFYLRSFFIEKHRRLWYNLSVLFCEVVMKSKLIGNRAFYRMALSLAVPIMIQTGITNFVNMLDNLMVGSVGTEAITGVSVANQLIFVFNLSIYGAVTGIGIYTAQYFGKSDGQGVIYTFRFKFAVCMLLTLIFGAIMLTNGDFVLGLYLRGEGSADSARLSGEIAFDYIKIICIGIIPYAVSQCYGSTLRETGRPKVPMYAGIVAVLVNLALNYALIFGHFGLPRLGTKGAAIATVVSRFVELIYVSAAVHIGKKSGLLKGVFKGLYIPLWLVARMSKKSAPLLLNELLWSTGIAFVNQCYSVRGLAVVAADNIVLAFFDLFSVVFFSVGISIGIIVGHLLGADKREEAVDTAGKLRAFSVFTAFAVALVFIGLSFVVPNLYNTTNEVRYLAKWMMIIMAFAMPVDAFAQASYFTLRSGGKVLITMIFDSFFVWAVSVPFAFVISRYTALPILPFFALSLSLNILKCVLGYFYVKKGSWVKNIVGEKE